MELRKIIDDYLKNESDRIKQSTYLHYLKLSEIYLPQISINKSSEINLNELFENRFHKNLSNGTLKVLKSLINRALEFSFKSKKISNHIQITTNIKQQEKKNVEVLSTTEINKLENYILCEKDMYKYGFIISLHTGLRIGELLSLKWQNVDLEERVLVVNSTISDKFIGKKMFTFEDEPKSVTSKRKIPIAKNLFKIFKELRKNYPHSEFVINSKNGKRVFIRAYQESFSRCLKKLGIRHYGFHSLRHTFATRCYQNGMDIKTLSEILGHSNPNITLNIYVHTSFELKLKQLDAVCKKLNKNSYPN